MNIRIAQIGTHPAVAFAVAELHRLLRTMDHRCDISIVQLDAYMPERTHLLFVGMDARLAARLPRVEDPARDDALLIDVHSARGVVSGSNPRSVLMAVYRLMRENGCYFVRPGEDGEFIPQKPADALCAQVCEAAAHRYRALCIEGACSDQHVCDVIDWLPKVGMNGYFVQFFTPYTFYDRWYAHQLNPTLAGEAERLSRADVDGFVAHLRSELKKRGLFYQAVGHGWTCEPIGLPADGWDAFDYEVSDQARALLAERNDERSLYEGLPINTNLCYGNPKVRDLIVNAIADYCAAQPDVDYVHFWLGDANNNHCECPLCRDTLPADFYVMMLNQLDEELTRRGIDTRVVFLIYQDLLWAPQREKIHHPDRFVLMFAPITRTYSQPFDPKFTCEEYPSFRRNHNVIPASVGQNLRMLRDWDGAFRGDSFIFEYHFMWDHLLDAGYYGLGDVLSQDIKRLHEMGLNGYVSCQLQRTFFPTAYGMHVLAETLWNPQVEIETIAQRYFEAAFGAQGESVRAYLSGISQRMDARYLRGELPLVDPQRAADFQSAVEWIDAFRPQIEQALAAVQPSCRRSSWRALQIHAGFTAKLARALTLKAQGDFDGCMRIWEALRHDVQRAEPETQALLDTMFYQKVLEKALANRETKSHWLLNDGNEEA